jgi:hypothetical protein
MHNHFPEIKIGHLEAEHQPILYVITEGQHVVELHVRGHLSVWPVSNQQGVVSIPQHQWGSKIAFPKYLRQPEKESESEPNHFEYSFAALIDFGFEVLAFILSFKLFLEKAAC